MSILAIKGDIYHGHNVITLLEMLGGNNKRFELKGFDDNVYYYIDRDGDIISCYTDDLKRDTFICLTLNEFYEKYPYKVGDKVTLDHKLCTVIWMCWECNNIYYAVQNQEAYCMHLYTKKVTADELKPYKETNMNKKKKLAIKGHPTRGKEVIELLEMLGGKNCYNLNGLFSENAYYFIGGPHNNEILGGEYMFGNEKIYWFTLEEFLKKYPFKVGDKVFLYDNITLGCVTGMKWDEETVKYCVYTSAECWCDVKDLLKWNAIDLVEKHYKEQDNMETTVESNKRDRDDVLFDSIIWHLRNSVNNGKQHLSGGDCEAYFRKLVKKVKMYKPVYPKTYEECREILNEQADVTYGYNRYILHNLQVLLVCRDAYWKIAGEQMGLSGSWKPNWSDTKEEVYGIQLTTDDTNMIYHESASFTFPTEEILNEFCKNFKYLIEQCKELL